MSSNNPYTPAPFPTPLDVVTLAEAYGEKAIQEIQDSVFDIDVIMHNVQRAIHWAWVFTHLDNSYLREWKIDEVTRNQGVE